ncbi:Spo0E family sporulation regulatory protein-aspartic acid phosphatase [Siminovitchia sp. 179-K 8D1 HS]|uniref:Spo0E family sporulation regulatory protein-aspartic acid phosphatase n=1 Tax=Siminovitchia sp. 179-K 8D1 HS TaxID=3142385 RepID=UPI0039A0A36A
MKIIGGGEQTMGYGRKEQQILLAKIQEKRKEMLFIGNQYGLTAEETVTCSQELDQLLNEYHQRFQAGKASQNAGHARKKSFVLFSKSFHPSHIRSS